jgi:mannose-1-phosphate guanylyltransferase
MDAIVLAGGEGTRLRPLTEQRPKGLVPILGRPLLGLLLGHIQRHGFTRVALALTHGPSSDAIVRAFESDPTLAGTIAPGLEVWFAFEDIPLGSGGALATAASTLGATSDPVLVCNGDLVSDIDLTAMRTSHRTRAAELTIALFEVAEPSRFGVAALDDADRITAFVEKPAPGAQPSNLANAGFWLFSASLIAATDGRAFNRVEDMLFPSLARAGRPIFGFRHTGHWRDVGTPEAYREAVMDALDRSAAPFDAQSPRWVDPTANIAPAATVQRSAIGEHVVIEEGAVVIDSVLRDRVHIGAGARIERAVLGTGFKAAPGAVIADACLVPPSPVAAHAG